MKTILTVLILVIAVALVWALGRDTGELASLNPPSPATATEIEEQSAEIEFLGAAREPESEESGGRAEIPGSVNEDSPVQAPDSVLDPATAGRLAVQVVAKETGAPLQGVHVRVRAFRLQADPTVEWMEKQEEGNSPLTDAEGRASFLLSPDAHIRVWVTVLPDGATENRSLKPFAEGEARTLRLELPTQSDAHFIGRVVEAESGEAIAGALVRFISDTYSVRANGTTATSSRTAQEFRTGPEGWFETPVATWRQQYARVDAEGFGPRMFFLEPGHEERENALIVDLSRGAKLRGLILGPSDFDDLEVRVRASGYELDLTTRRTFDAVGDDRRKTTVSPAGTWELADLPPGVGLEMELWQGEKRLRIESEKLHLGPGEERSLEWYVGGGTTLRGRAVIADTNEPLAALPIWLVAGTEAWGLLQIYTPPVARTTTDDRGNFTFPDLPPGEWGIGPAPHRSERAPLQDDEVAPVATKVSILEGVGTLDVELRLYRGLYIRGQVLGLDGKPVKLAHVTGDCIDNAVSSFGPATDGTFRIGPLVPGSYQLSATGGSNSSKSLPVTAMAGDEDVVLRLSAGGSIEGKLVDASTGDPLKGPVSVTQQAGWYGLSSMMKAQSDGLFSLGGLIPGTYDVFARSGDLVGRVEGVVVGPLQSVKDLEVRLEPGAVLVVTYTGDAERAAFRVMFGESRIHVDGLVSGLSSRVTLPAGEVLVSVDHWDANDVWTSVESTYDLIVGEETVVEIRD